MKLGLALFRCGEPQCSATLSDSKIMSQFHCVHVAENISPYHVAVNTTLKKCFDDGADWVVMMDGDMILLPNIFDAIKSGLQFGRKCMHFRLRDDYIGRDIGTVKVVTKEWMEAAGWYQDALATDRDAEARAREKGFPRVSSHEIVATHFDNPTQFQIFKRFYIRGMKVAQGYLDGIDYKIILNAFAFGAYEAGYKQQVGTDPHRLPDLLTAYESYIRTFDPVICGVCAWGDFPYHYHDKIRPSDPRYTPVDKRNPGFKALYVNRLAVAVGRYMKCPHLMHYLAPEPIPGVIPECKWVKLDSPFTVKNLNKFGMYHTDYLALGNQFIMFDLDNVPVGDMSPMVDAVKRSNGFLCRSERATLRRNIPGGDMIGYKKETGAAVLAWIKDFLAKHQEVANFGAERFVYRYMVEEQKQWSQYWWEFLGDEAILGWKGQIRDGRASITPKTMLISGWGDWALHEIAKKYPQSWTRKWESQYCTLADKAYMYSSPCTRCNTIPSSSSSSSRYPDEQHYTQLQENPRTDILVWKISRRASNHGELYDALVNQLPDRIKRDANGFVIYRRDRGDLVRLQPNKALAHPNSLLPVDPRTVG